MTLPLTCASDAVRHARWLVVHHINPSARARNGSNGGGDERPLASVRVQPDADRAGTGARKR